MGVQALYTTLHLSYTYSHTYSLFHDSKTHIPFVLPIKVPLAAALCDALIYNSMDIPDLPARYVTVREKEIARRRAAGEPMAFKYAQIKELLDPFYHTYICKDGRPFYVVAPCHEIHQRRVRRRV